MRVFRKCGNNNPANHGTSRRLHCEYFILTAYPTPLESICRQLPCNSFIPAHKRNPARKEWDIPQCSHDGIRRVIVPFLNFRIKLRDHKRQQPFLVYLTIPFGAEFGLRRRITMQRLVKGKVLPPGIDKETPVQIDGDIALPSNLRSCIFARIFPDIAQRQIDAGSNRQRWHLRLLLEEADRNMRIGLVGETLQSLSLHESCVLGPASQGLQMGENTIRDLSLDSRILK